MGALRSRSSSLSATVSASARTQWDKQLFNGTVVTVEDLEVRRMRRIPSVTRKTRKPASRQSRRPRRTLIDPEH